MVGVVIVTARCGYTHTECVRTGVVCGVWRVVCGVWCVVCGAWSVLRGVRCLCDKDGDWCVICINRCVFGVCGVFVNVS